MNKDWAESDRVRDQIAALGFSVNDNPDGTDVLPL
jgi:cysteinyl-tRNA synthetase